MLWWFISVHACGHDVFIDLQINIHLQIHIDLIHLYTMSRRPLARPKRFADQFDTSNPSLSSSLPQPSSKKARTNFDTRNPSTLAADDDADEDAILELDEIGRKGTQTKRNAVELDGYETDSSQENFDARAEARVGASGTEKVKGKGKGKGKGKLSKDEEEADMFADLEEDFVDGDDDEDVAQEGKKRKKEVRFMEANEIEGQVASSKSGGHVSADFSLNSQKTGKEQDSSSEEGDDELRDCLLYTSPSPRDGLLSRMPSSA